MLQKYLGFISVNARLRILLDWSYGRQMKRRCSFSVVKVSSLLRAGRKIKRKTTNCATSNLAGDLNVRSLDTRSAFTSSIIHISWCNTTLPVAQCTNGWVTQMNIHGVSCKVLKGVCAQNSNAIHFFLLPMCWRRICGRFQIHTRISLWMDLRLHQWTGENQCENCSQFQVRRLQCICLQHLKVIV